MAAILGLIALLTLWPSPGSAGPGGLWCFGCGSIGTLDLINNILLFAPVGAVLAARGSRLLQATAAGGLISFTIEALQFLVVPGRDAAPSDVVMNSIGTAVGWVLFATYSRWLHPTRSEARWYTLAAGVAFLGVLTASGWLLLPSVPADDLFGQWAPRRPPYTQYRGQLLSFDINGFEIPHSPVPDPGGVREAIARRAALAAITTIPALPPDGAGAVIGRLVAVDHEVFLLAQRDTSLVGRFRLRSSEFRMRTLSLTVPDALRPNERVRVEGGYEGTSLVARVVRPDGVVAAQLPLRVSLGWAFVRPIEIPLGPWEVWVSGGWLALLTLPLGFYAACATRRDRGVVGWTFSLAIGVSGAFVLAGLVLVPRLTAAAPSGVFDWAGAAMGVVVGWLISVALRGATAHTTSVVGATDGPGLA